MHHKKLVAHVKSHASAMSGGGGGDPYGLGLCRRMGVGIKLDLNIEGLREKTELVHEQGKHLVTRWYAGSKMVCW